MLLGFDDLAGATRTQAGSVVADQQAALGIVFTPNALTGASLSSTGLNGASNTDLAFVRSDSNDAGELGAPDRFSADVQAHHNVVESFSNGGIGMAGGHHMQGFSDRVVSASRAPGGRLIGATFGAGAGFCNFCCNPLWAAHSLHDNHGRVADRDCRIADNCLPFATAGTVYSNVIEGTPYQVPAVPLTTDVQRREREAWLLAVKRARIRVGPLRA